MLTFFQALILGALQGLSELFPVSSLGHSVILPSVFGWRIDQEANSFLLFLVATHFATALVLLFFFRRDWWNILTGFIRSVRKRKIAPGDTPAKLAWLLIITTIPAGLLGLLLEHRLKLLLAHPQTVAIALALNGILLFLADGLRKKCEMINQLSDDQHIAKLSWWATIKIGLWQALALIPGFSRTGAAMTGGLFAGLSHEDAARFSFLLATPIIGAAAILKLPELLGKNERVAVGPILVGMLASAIAAYLTVKFLTKYFQTKTLKPFAWYCLIVGTGLSIFLLRY